MIYDVLINLRSSSCCGGNKNHVLAAEFCFQSVLEADLVNLCSLLSSCFSCLATLSPFSPFFPHLDVPFLSSLSPLYISSSLSFSISSPLPLCSGFLLFFSSHDILGAFTLSSPLSSSLLPCFLSSPLSSPLFSSPPSSPLPSPSLPPLLSPLPPPLSPLTGLLLVPPYSLCCSGPT